MEFSESFDVFDSQLLLNMNDEENSLILPDGFPENAGKISKPIIETNKKQVRNKSELISFSKKQNDMEKNIGDVHADENNLNLSKQKKCIELLPENSIEHDSFLKVELNSSKKYLSTLNLNESIEINNLNNSFLRKQRNQTLRNTLKKPLKHSPEKPLVNKTLDLEELKNMSSWNLPDIILQEYKRKGIIKMFDWQVQCLNIPQVLYDHENLIYSAPTSAGKTLISEILIIKTVLERKKKALVILPYISLVREKMCYFQDLLTSSGCRVEGFFGGYSPPGGFDTINVAICTIEKANSIINKLLEEGKLENIGIVVIDEIHLISDPSRGYILELLIAKILFVSKQIFYNIQIVAMSATLPNAEILKKWLNAKLFITNFRPVELNEMIKIGNKIFNNKMCLLRSLEANDLVIKNDQDHIAFLCIETILNNSSVLVFCPSKEWCETLCTNIARAIHDSAKINLEITKQLNKDLLLDLKTQLKKSSTGLDLELEKAITYGCAFHHAGLTIEERDTIEHYFKNSVLKILIATSTLSSGVNLPARRVIIRSPLFAGKQMSSLTYRQMIGRAGRTGIDSIGESILICNEKNTKEGKELISAILSPICSCLGFENSKHLNRALLEVISSEVAQTENELQEFVKCTLFEHELNQKLSNNMEITNILNNCLEFLLEYEFIRLQNNTELSTTIYVATCLGMACLTSSLPPSDGLILLAELQKSRRCFVLESDINALYLVTPYSVCAQLHNIDWLLYLELWEKLSPSMKRVGDIVGVKESFIIKAMRGYEKLDYKSLQVHKRFYTALALHELVNEIPLRKVALKYNFCRGLLQNLQQMASTYAGMLTLFCKSLNWNLLSLIISQYKERLFFGVDHDLIELVKLPELNSARARALFNAGISNLMQLANSNVCVVEKILHNCISFDSNKNNDGEDEFETNKRKNLRNIIITGDSKLTVQQAAQKLINDARKFIEFEIGVEHLNWKSLEINSNKLDLNKIELECNKANLLNATKNHLLQENSFVVENDNTNSDNRINDKEKLDLNEINENLNNLNIEDKLNSSHIMSSSKNECKASFFESLLIVNICGNIKLFEQTILELLQSKSIGFSIFSQKIYEKSQILIGPNAIAVENNKEKFKDELYEFIYDEFNYISGISFCFETNICFFLNMQTKNTDKNITKIMKINALKSIFENEELTLRMLYSKEQLKILKKSLSSINIKSKIEDPEIANWLLQPDINANIEQMTKQYAPECSSLINLFSNYNKGQSVEIKLKNEQLRSSALSCISFHILNNQIENLSRIADGQLKKFFNEIEMPIQKSLAHMECVGISIYKNDVNMLITFIRDTLKKIELNLNKMKGVNLVLGIHKKTKKKTLKEILDTDNSSMVNFETSYRKLTWILNHSILPLLKYIKKNKIFQNNITLTSTGRISMSSPNLQSIPKDIEISFSALEKQLISCRSLFLAQKGNCFVSADYCQLEMRILSHLSQDLFLKKIMESNCDIFSAISAKWNNMEIANVSDKLRNRTKQICYGIIYGIGIKKLSEVLKCAEDEAIIMCESFHKAYPGIRAYVKKIIEFAKQNGYIETISGRRRYLDNINNEQVSLKNQAERRAINSTIQGSAADITKSAILRMEKNIIKYNQKLGMNINNVKLVHHLHDELIYEVTQEQSVNIAKILKITMENCVQLSIPLKVKLKIGQSWGKLKEFLPISSRSK